MHFQLKFHGVPPPKQRTIENYWLWGGKLFSPRDELLYWFTRTCTLMLFAHNNIRKRGYQLENGKNVGGVLREGLEGK